MKADIIGGLIFLILIFAIVVYIIGYNIFTDAFKKEYTSVTHHMADSAAAIVNSISPARSRKSIVLPKEGWMSLVRE